MQDHTAAGAEQSRAKQCRAVQSSAVQHEAMRRTTQFALPFDRQ